MQKNMESSHFRAVIGLGNPGPQYEGNRHNIGFIIIDLLAEQFSTTWKSSDNMEIAEIRISLEKGEGDIFALGRTIYLIKPQTFMNSCGKVLPFLLKRGIEPEEILVIHDELEKPFGKTDLRFNGSPRGHNGLRSIMGVIGKDFWRFYFGIDRPEDKSEVGKYVLSNFSPEEEKNLSDLVREAASKIKEVLDKV